FECASPDSYLAVGRIAPLAAARDVAVVWRPFLLGPIFRAQGWNDSPFNVYPVKGQYMWRDLERLCAKYGLPLRRPSAFPRNGLTAARVACVASREAWCADFVRRVYRANFADDRDIADVTVLADLLGALGQPAADVLARAGAPETKDALRRQTERAIEL